MRFADADAALEWLSRAFGFEEHIGYRGDEDVVHHAEISLGPGIVSMWSFGTYRPEAGT